MYRRICTNTCTQNVGLSFNTTLCVLVQPCQHIFFNDLKDPSSNWVEMNCSTTRCTLVEMYSAKNAPNMTCSLPKIFRYRRRKIRWEDFNWTKHDLFWLTCFPSKHLTLEAAAAPKTHAAATQIQAAERGRQSRKANVQNGKAKASDAAVQLVGVDLKFPQVFSCWVFHAIFSSQHDTLDHEPFHVFFGEINHGCARWRLVIGPYCYQFWLGWLDGQIISRLMGFKNIHNVWLILRIDYQVTSIWSSQEYDDEETHGILFVGMFSESDLCPIHDSSSWQHIQRVEPVWYFISNTFGLGSTGGGLGSQHLIGAELELIEAMECGLKGQLTQVLQQLS